MKKETQKKAEDLINYFISTYGDWSFRFTNQYDNVGDREGFANIEEKVVVLKRNAGSRTLAHEIAHIAQYERRGRTECMSTYPRNTKEIWDLISEHQLIEDAFLGTMLELGIAQKYDEMVGQFYKVYEVGDERFKGNM